MRGCYDGREEKMEWSPQAWDAVPYGIVTPQNTTLPDSPRWVLLLVEMGLFPLAGFCKA
jgi:hypothetical protein